MKSKYINRQGWLMVLLVCVGLWSFSGETNNRNAVYYQDGAISDTLPFNPNSAAGWGILNSYLKINGDSVELELVLYRHVTDSLAWNMESETGTIAQNYLPSTDRQIVYVEGRRTWGLTVKATGKCLVRLLSGPVPRGNPGVLPIQTKFKN